MIKHFKVCSACKLKKPASAFYIRSKRARLRQLTSRCKPCESLKAAYYAKQRVVIKCNRCSVASLKGKCFCATHLKESSDKSRALARQAKRLAVTYKGSCCFDCGLRTDVLSVYDFHHLDPKKKDFSFRDVRRRCRLELDAELKAELDKCVMLCANCHRIRHWFVGAL